MFKLTTNDVTVLYAQAFGLSMMEYGHALWNADHPDPEVLPEIGSIGFIYKGKWVQIGKLDSPEISQHILTNSIQADEPLRTSNVRVTKLDATGSFSVGPAVNVETSVTYNSFKEFEAILTLSEPAERKDASNVLYFKKAMCQNYLEWHRKARKVHHFDVDLDEIILVTGCDYGTDWANAVMKTKESETDVTIAVGAAGFAEGRFSAAIKESKPGSNIFRKNWGPSERTGKRDQILFVRGCKIVTRGWIDNLRRKRSKKLLITDAMHLCEPLEFREDCEDALSSTSGRDNSDEEGDQDPPSSNGSGTSSSSRRLFSRWFSSSSKSSSSGASSSKSPSSSSPKTSTRNASPEPMAEPYGLTENAMSSSSLRMQKPKMEEDFLEEISDPLSVLLLYMLENSDAEFAVAHHSDLAELTIPKSRTMEEFMANLYKVKPSITVEDGLAWISTSEELSVSSESDYLSSSITDDTLGHETNPVTALSHLTLISASANDQGPIVVSSVVDISPGSYENDGQLNDLSFHDQLDDLEEPFEIKQANSYLSSRSNNNQVITGDATAVDGLSEGFYSMPGDPGNACWYPYNTLSGTVLDNRPVMKHIPQGDRCLPNTRQALHRSITDWVASHSKEQKIACWHSGPAGAGKSIIATAIAERMHGIQSLGAFFYFDRDIPKRGAATLIRTPAYAEQRDTMYVAANFSANLPKETLPQNLVYVPDTTFKLDVIQQHFQGSSISAVTEGQRATMQATVKAYLVQTNRLLALLLGLDEVEAVGPRQAIQWKIFHEVIVFLKAVFANPKMKRDLLRDTRKFTTYQRNLLRIMIRNSLGLTEGKPERTGLSKTVDDIARRFLDLTATRIPPEFFVFIDFFGGLPVLNSLHLPFPGQSWIVPCLDRPPRPRALCVGIERHQGEDPNLLTEIPGAHQDAEKLAKALKEKYMLPCLDCPPRRRALCVGIERYQGEDPNLLTEIPGAHQDAEKLAKALKEKYGYEVALLLDDGVHDEPNKANIMTALTKLICEAKAGDRLFFHYSGHGGQVTNKDGLEEDGLDEALIPIGAKMEEPRESKRPKPEWRKETVIRDDELIKLVALLPPESSVSLASQSYSPWPWTLVTLLTL
ncbi:hypothetical protein M422DRAFT_37887 [Sphaerobolus stellatus SS14]|uniref:Metacaspase-1 n=1 Tax=Sphaerobolus stellatus (strain SS14) TaxID=990650 RepID=A0A0C9UP97_SPHS4|nr:hypothetical protein M422DRAFT_37887 [Sphaerobolus stellatus SS14]